MEPSSYGRWQKSTAALLVGTLLFSSTFEIPFSLPKAHADAFQRRVDVVSIIVDADVYPLVSSEIERYGLRIQKELPDTRTVIFPLPKSTQPQFIAALNEKLYWDGESTTRAAGTVEQLVGTVLVGDVPLPVVHKAGKSYLSVFPYVDFRDKAFKFDFTKGLFDASQSAGPQRPEIWHGVIAPHTGDVAKDAAALKEFFAKVERAYDQSGEFASTGQKPYVFWFDSIKESKAIVPSEWRAYNDLYLPNLEDLTYRRFTKYLAKYLYDGYQQASTDPTKIPVPFAQWRGTLSGSTDASIPLDGLPSDVAAQVGTMAVGGGGTDMSNVPDASTRDFIFKSVKRYAEVVNSKYLGDMAKYVYGAGRYNEGLNAQVDTPAVLITKKDSVTAAALKDANTLLENAIDAYVRKHLAQDVPALAQVKEKIELYEPVWHDWDACRGFGTVTDPDTGVTSASSVCEGGWDRYRHYLHGFNAYAQNEFSYKNFLFGQDVSGIKEPSQCTIVRGSSLTGSQYLVEANVAYDPNATKEHAAAILGNFDGAHPAAVSEIPGNTGATTGLCMAYDPDKPEGNGFRTMARWGGNSPLNAVPSSVPTVLKSQRYNSFYQSILDVGGSKQLETGSPLTVASPLDCAKTDLLLAPYTYTMSRWNGETRASTDEDGTVHGPAARLPDRLRGWPRDSAFIMDALKASNAWGIARVGIDDAKEGKEYSCATRFDLTTENDDIFNAFTVGAGSHPGGFNAIRSNDNRDGKAFDLSATNALSKDFARIFRDGLCVNPSADAAGVTCAGSGSVLPDAYGLRTAQLPGIRSVPLNVAVPALGGDYAVSSSRLNGSPVGLSAIDAQIPTDGSVFKRQGITSLTFHRVSSVLEHKSPTDAEYGALATSLATPSMPVDRDRYVAFVSTLGTQEKITYPNLFRVAIEKPEDFTPENAQGLIKARLDAVSAQINDVGSRNDPAKTDDAGRTIRGFMGGSPTVAPQADLWAQFSSNAELKALAIESVLWANLRNAPAKYGYVLDNWLDRDGRNGISKAMNPGHRPDGYEIAYIAGQGSADRLRLDVDPSRNDGAGGSVALMLARNARFDNLRRAANIAQGGNQYGSTNLKTSKVFNCGPAEGVVITVWIPAIMCWLKENMPPKIKWTGRKTAGSLPDGSNAPEALPGPDLSKDADDNGLADAYEAAIKDPANKLTVQFAKETYGPGDSVQFEAGFQNKDGSWLSWDQQTVVDVSVSKIQAVQNGTTSTYVPGADAAAWNATVSKFINFSPRSLRASDGRATYGFSGLGKEATVWIQAEAVPKDKNGDIVPGLAKRSVPAPIDLAEPTLRVTAAAASEVGGAMTPGADYVAGEERGIRFSISSADPRRAVVPPLTLNVLDPDTGAAILPPSKVMSLPADGSYSYRWNDDHSPVLSKAGDYLFQFTDKRGFTDGVKVSVVPAAPEKLTLDMSSDVLVKGADYAGVVKLADRFGNLVVGHPKPVALRVTGPAKLSVGDAALSAVADPYLFEGFAPLRVNAYGEGAVTVAATIQTSAGDLTASAPLRAVETAKATVTFDGGAKPRVGGGSYPFSIHVTDGAGAPLPVNAVATFRFPESLGRLDAAAVAVEKGVARATLITGFLAARSGKLDVSVPGITDISGNEFAVLPGDPMTVDVRPASPELSADGKDVTSVRAVLLDRFGNTVFDSAPEYAADFSISNPSALSFLPGQTATGIKFVEGETPRVIVRATQFAGTAYAVATVTPALENNSFTYVDPQDASRSVSAAGISSNAAPILSSFSLDAQKLASMRYNALFTVLLGGAYGDVTRTGYLGGAMLFSQDSKAVAVATLANSPLTRTPVLEFSPTGRLTMTASDEVADLSAEWGLRGGVPAMEFFNRVDQTLVARAWLPLTVADAAAVACSPKSDEAPFQGCALPKDGGALALAGSIAAGITASKSGGVLTLRSGGATVATVGPDGTISGDGVTAVPDASVPGDGLALAIWAGGQRIGALLVRFPADGGVNLIREGDPRAANKISVEIASSRFTAARRHVGGTTNAAEGVAVELLESGVATTDADLSLGATVPGFESHLDEDGVGWAGGNKTLLEAASGVPVGEAVRKYQGWSTIVLGDPVFHLTPQAKTRSDGSKPDFDHTVGEAVGQPEGNLVGFDLADVNGDGTKDVVGYLDNGDVELWGDFNGKRKAMALLISAPDVGAGQHVAGDFFGDKYDDIVAVSSKGRLVVFENTGGAFTRIPASVNGEPLTGRITQLKAYDMDADGRMDLVVVDDTGVLSVLYGTAGNTFTRVVVDRGLGFQLDPRSLSGSTANAAVYYEGAGGIFVPTGSGATVDYSACDSAPSQNAAPAAAAAGGGGGGGFSLNFIDFSLTNLATLLTQEKKSKNTAAANGKTPCQIEAETKGQTADQQADVVNKFLFYKLLLPSGRTAPADASSAPADTATTFNQLSGSDENGNPHSDGSGIAADLAAVQAAAPRGTIDYAGLYEAGAGGATLTGLRNSFVDPAVLSVTKSYTGTLTEGSPVRATLTVRNVSADTLTSLVVADKDNPAFASDDSGEAELSYRGDVQSLAMKEDPGAEFTNLYDLRNYPLKPGESLTITYGLLAPRMQVGKIDVGLYEDASDGSDGADTYGDILYSPSKSCSSTKIFWSSLNGGSGRAFHKGVKKFTDDSMDKTSNDALKKAQCSMAQAKDMANSFGDPDAATKAANANSSNGVKATDTLPWTLDLIPPMIIVPFPVKPFNGIFLPDGLKLGTKIKKPNAGGGLGGGRSGGGSGASCPVAEDATAYSQDALADFNKDADNNGVPDRAEGDPGIIRLGLDSGMDDAGNLNFNLNLGISDQQIDAIDSQVDAFISGLGCGFGGGGCISSPINYAPLAPGASPVAFGIPLNIAALTPYTWGLPIFAASTNCILPMTWPPCPIGAGGWIVPLPPISTFRLYVTPTITGAIGTTMCFGPNMSAYMMPPGLSPLVPGGNCINIAFPIPGLCKGDGSDGDAGNLGPASSWNTSGNAQGGRGNGSDNSFVNAESCDQDPAITQAQNEADAAAMVTDARAYLASRGSNFTAGNSFLGRAKRNAKAAKMPPDMPLIVISGGFGDDEDGYGLDLDLDLGAGAGDIIKVKNIRLPSFPDFIMDWVTRQIEEIASKLMTLPRLIIVLPDLDAVNQGMGQWKDFFGKLRDGSIYNAAAAQKMADQKKQDAARQASLKTGAARAYGSGGIALSGKLGLNSASQTVGGIRAAFDFIGNLPLIDLDWRTIRVPIPWFGPEDLDAWIVRNLAVLTGDIAEIDRFTKEITDLASGDPEKWASTIHVVADLDQLRRSLENNIKTVQEYKDFPKKLSKFVRWKEKYVNDIINNYVQPVSQLLVGWMTDNGKRFKSWVELIVLIKAILKSWQVFIDLFADFSAQCSVCRVQRYDLKYWLIKLISMLIPKIPIIIFPKWPDIELDLHDISLGVKLAMPEFDFQLVPIKLPTLVPKLYLPEIPTVDLRLTLPAIPQLPKLPELPDLPELPLLPLPILPDLPPPPILPKLLASISAVVNILKLLLKAICILNKNPFAPEWDSGVIIAMLTDRSGPLPIDKLFIDFGFPSNPTMTYLDKIRVSTHVNLKFDVDFITEMIEQALNPYARTAEGLANSMRDIRVPDIDLRNLVPPEVRDGVQIDASVGADGKAGVKSNLDGSSNLQGMLLKTAVLAALGLREISRALEAARDDKPTMEQFKAALAQSASELPVTEHPGYKIAADLLRGAVAYSGQPEQDHVDALRANLDAKFKALGGTLSRQAATAGAQAAEIEAAYADPKTAASTKTLAAKLSAFSFAAADVDAKPDFSPFNAKLAAAMTRLADPAADPREAAATAEKTRLLARVDSGMSDFAKAIGMDYRGLAATAALSTAAVPAAATASSSDASGDGRRFDYQGVYVLNGGRSERLFDYVDEVDADTQVIPSPDGGVYYSMGNQIWYKKNLNAADPAGSRHITGAPEVFTEREARKNVLLISSAAPISDVKLPPDDFAATTQESGVFGFQFTPANPQNDSHWRIQAFRNVTFPTVPADPDGARERWIFELFTGLDEKSYDPERTETGTVGYTHVATFHEASAGVGDLTQAKIVRVLLPGGMYREGLDGEAKALPGALNVRAGQPLYTGYYESRIRYVTQDGRTVEKNLAPRSRYAFGEDRRVEILTGEIYLVGAQDETRAIELDKMVGMPILPGARITVGKRSHLTISFNDGTHLRIPENTHFALMDLGSRSDSYRAQSKVPDGLYYATIRAVDRTQDVEGYGTMLSWQTLFAPARESDMDAPTLNLGKTMRIPINAERTVNFEKYALDPSDVKQFKVEGLSADVSRPAGGEAKPLLWKFGPFPHSGKKRVHISAADEMGNWATWDLDLLVSVPDAKIVDAVALGDDAQVEGRVSVQEAGVPVDIFRFRDGHVQKATPTWLPTDAKGAFSFTGTARGQAALTGPSGEVARFDSVTGAPVWLAAGWTTKFITTTETEAAHLAVKDPANNVVYRQFWGIRRPGSLAQASSAAQVPARGDGWWWVPAPASDPASLHMERASAADPSLPNGAYLVRDADGRAALALSSGGQVYLLNSGFPYSVEYFTDGAGWPALKVKKDGLDMGALHLRTTAPYVNE